VAASRAHDVGSSQGRAHTLEILRARGARLHEIALAPLARDEMIRLVADAVRCDRTHAEPLATVLHQKTDGNPLFAVQLLAALVDDGSLAFDPTAAAWRWDLARIREKGPTGSLAELMVRKVSRLPAHTKAALGDLAFLGSSAESALLSLVLEVPEKAVHAALLDAARTGLIVRRHNTYAFLHDRFRQAAYALVPDAERAANHLRIARLLAAHTDVEPREETIFEVGNQFNHGAGLASSDAEREHIAELNLLAGRRAKGSTAYEAALNYFRAGDATLPDESRERRPELAFALSFHRAECEFLLGDLAAAEARLSALAARVDGLADRAAVACSRIAVYTTLDRYDRAVAVGREYLAHAGIAWPPHPTDDDVRREYERMWATIADRPIEALADLPRMTAAERRATMDVLVLLVEVALFTDANLFALALGTMVNWSLEYGNSDASCLAYAQLIMVLGPRFGDYPSGFRFGQLGLDLVEPGGRDRHAARVYLVFGHHVMPWMRPLQSGRALLHRALQTAQATGDVTYAAYSGTLLVTNLLASGAPLADVQA